LYFDDRLALGPLSQEIPQVVKVHRDVTQGCRATSPTSALRRADGDRGFATIHVREEAVRASNARNVEPGTL